MTATPDLPAPEALLLDMDGVLADVTGSYREAIRRTAASFGADVTLAEIAAAKAEGDANNDWVLTQRLVSRRGVDVRLGEVVARFEALYEGTPEAPGLYSTERLLAPAEVLRRLAARLPLGLVTGRPRPQAERFLRLVGLAELFRASVCMGEATAPKPDPAPVRLALDQLGVRRAWMVGDTPDDVRAALGAGVVPLGVIAPGEPAELAGAALMAAGAVAVLQGLADLEELLS